MPNEDTRQLWARLEPKLNTYIEEMVWGLFADSKAPFFDKGKLSSALIDEFCRDKDIQFLTFEYVRKLGEVWESRFPGKGKLMPKIRPKVEPPARPVNFPTLAATPGGLSNVPPPIPADALVPGPATSPTQSTVPGGPVTTQPTNSGNNFPPTTPAAAAPASMASPQTLPPVPPASPSVAPATSAAGLKPGQVPPNPVKPAAIPDSKPTFHLPNCKVGAPFSAKIEGTDKSGRLVWVADLRFPDGFGLTFDPATQMVTGQPLLDGEFDLDLQWSFVDAPGKVSGICKLTSNPDPKSLWKVIEPAGDLPYRKSHLDQKLLKGAGFSIAAASRRGRSHEHGGSFRDDDFFISDDPTTGWSVMIVADGAGSAKNSREGSRIAVETAGKHLVDNLSGEFGAKVSGLLGTWDSDASSQNAIGTEFHYFFHKMAGNAIQAIEQEAQAQSAPVKEYSTTLLAAAVKKDGANTFLATFWMGDGAIAAYGPRGTVKLMGTPDGGEFAGQTRFLDRNALADQGFGKRVRVGRLQNVSSVILMTDGVSDPYFETDNGLADPAKWDVLWDEIQPQLGDAAPEQRLVEWLHFFKQGHHDDRTIALLW